MASLIRLTFEPLYPVCDGELIFFTNATGEEGFKQAVQDIAEIYLRWIDIADVTVTYLGKFEPAYDGQFEDNVITYQNGDY